MRNTPTDLDWILAPFREVLTRVNEHLAIKAWRLLGCHDVNWLPFPVPELPWIQEFVISIPSNGISGELTWRNIQELLGRLMTVSSLVVLGYPRKDADCYEPVVRVEVWDDTEIQVGSPQFDVAPLVRGVLAAKKVQWVGLPELKRPGA